MSTNINLNDVKPNVQLKMLGAETRRSFGKQVADIQVNFQTTSAREFIYRCMYSPHSYKDFKLENGKIYIVRRNEILTVEGRLSVLKLIIRALHENIRVSETIKSIAPAIKQLFKPMPVAKSREFATAGARARRR